MNCISKHELTERDLLMYLDGVSTREIATHLELCQHCQQRAQQLARVQGRLKARLHRIDCPNPLQLGEYHLDMLPEGETEIITQHLESCPHCTNEVAQLETYMGALAPDMEPSAIQQVKQRAKILVARLVRTGARSGATPQPLLEPAYAGTRGPREEPYRYEAGSVVILIEILTDARHADRRKLQGMVLGLENYVGAEVHLWQGSNHISTEAVTSTWNFSFSDLAPDSYELILSTPEEEIHIQDLQVV